MERQLILLDDGASDHQAVWRLDEDTRERGRKGVALARAALMEAAQRRAA